MNDINEYLKKEKTKVSQEVNKKIKIYLDTKYWVDICDVTRGVKKNDDINMIYTFLKNKVKNNEVICPISQVLFKEVLKQSDEDSLTHTVKIIDELSQGIIICNQEERFSLELYNFFYDTLKIEMDKNLKENFWCKGIAHIFGIQIPYNLNFTTEINYIIQQEYFNEIKKYKFLDFIKILGMDKLKLFRDSRVDTNWFDRNKQDNIHKYKVFNELYMIEIAGSIDFYKNNIEEVFKDVIDNRAKQENIIFHEKEKFFDIQLILNMIYNIFKEKKIDLYLPSLDIGAMLHAKIRWNKTQKYKQGDLDDFRHAITALPYYDYFFTEKSLHNMIKECKYDKKYNCIVASKNNEILDILEKLNLL